MRIDKYLKAAHILKRRTVSRDLALNERIEINGRVVKPAHEVRPGDIVTITFGTRRMQIEVLSTEEIRRKRDTVDMYRVLSESTAVEPDN